MAQKKKKNPGTASAPTSSALEKSSEVEHSENTQDWLYFTLRSIKILPTANTNSMAKMMNSVSYINYAKRNCVTNSGIASYIR